MTSIQEYYVCCFSPDCDCWDECVDSESMFLFSELPFHFAELDEFARIFQEELPFADDFEEDDQLCIDWNNLCGYDYCDESDSDYSVGDGGDFFLNVYFWSGYHDDIFGA